MRILFVRANKGYPDSRVEKEMQSLSGTHEVSLFGWNRSESFRSVRHHTRIVEGHELHFYHVGIESPLGEGFRKIFIPMIRFWVKEFLFLVWYHKNYDVLHCCDLDTVISAFPVAFLFRKKIVYDIFDYYSESHIAPPFIKKILKLIEDKVISHSDAVIICSEQRREQIKDSTPKKVIVIHNAPPELTYTSSKIIRMNTKRVKFVYVGMLSRDRFLEEMAAVIEKRDDIEWHVGGMGVLQEFFEEKDRNYSNIFFYGKLAYKDAMQLEKECDVMTAIYNPSIPNHKYAAPNKFYEALMLRKPILMIKGTGMDSYVSEYGLGEVIDITNSSFISQFKVGLDKLLEKKAKWGDIGEVGHQLYIKEFSWMEMERRLLKLYDEIETRK